MLRLFSVKNFRQFREELVFDFTNTRDYQFNPICVKDGLVNKAIIYGKNAVGKTNLMEAMRDIYITNFSRFLNRGDISYRNADSSADETIIFHYSFLFDGKCVDYQYEKTDYIHVVAERLILDNNIIFDYNRTTNHFNFENVSIIGAEQLQWDTFQQMSIDDDDSELTVSLTALRYVYNNTAIVSNTALTKLMRFVSGMRFSIGFTTFNRMPSLQMWLNELENSEEDKLHDFQSFLNRYGVQCDLAVYPEVDGRKRLYFDHKTPIDFINNMSSGTMLLTKFYLQFMTTSKPFSFLFIDEFDAYYHYELSEKIVKLLEEEFNCQVVLTTHNTNLLSNTIMRPDCFLILHDGKLTPICDATPRELRQGHNLEKLYLSGEFDAKQ